MKKGQPVNEKCRIILYSLCILFVISCLYFPVIHAPFLFDDNCSIIDNLAIHSLDLKKIYAFAPLRFIGYLSFALNFYVSKFNPLSYHLVNISVHILFILFSFLFIKTLWETPSGKAVGLSINEKKLLALATAFILAIHPLSTFAVSYVVQRLASMTALFYVGSLFFYLKARLSKNIQGKISWSFFFILFLICALFTKQNSFTIFPQLFFLELLCFNITRKKQIAFVIFLPLLVLGFYISIKSNFIDLNEIKTITMETTRISRIEYLLTQFSVLCFYLKAFFYPTNLALDYEYQVLKSITDTNVLIPAFALIVILLVTLWAATQKKFRLIAYGIIFYFTAISIESSIIPINDVIFLHRTYLPNLGLALTSILLSYIILKKWNINQFVLISIFFICTVILSGFTFKTNLIFQTPGKVWTRVLEVSPRSLRAHTDRGRDYYENKVYDKALLDFKKAIKLAPKYANIYNDCANIYLIQKKFEKALFNYNKAIDIDPTNAFYYNNRGLLFSQKKEYRKAILDFTKAVEIKPDYAKAYGSCGNIYRIQKKFEKALFNYNKAIDIDPMNAFYYIDRATLFSQKKEYRKAILDFTKAVEIKPDYAKAYHNRAIALYFLKNYAMAFSDVQKVLSLGEKVNPKLLRLLKKQMDAQ